MKRFSVFLLALFSLMFTMRGSVSAASNNLVLNPSAEAGASNVATSWSKGSWGSLSSSYTVPTTGAQEGSRSLKVTVSNYKSGDAKWVPDLVPVTAGATYETSLWYKSSVVTEVDVAYKLSNGTMQYVWLTTAPASSTTWKQIKATFTVPASAVSAQVFQAIAKNGWVQTDNYSISNTASTPPPTPTPTPIPAPTPTPVPAPQTPFSRPLVSIEFDDGWASAYTSGLPLVESFGWKPTQYVITETPGWQDYMTSAQIIDWNKRGDIGSHTVSHPSLPSLSTTNQNSELSNSKKYLDSLLGEQTKLFATPYCESNTSVVTIAKTLYQSLRNCTPVANTKANFNQYDIKSFIVLNTTTDAEIKNALASAKSSNGWLVLVWHEVAGDAKNSWSVSATTLKRQLQLVKDSGISVVPTQQALNESLGL